jgi:hypothetical protein
MIGFSLALVGRISQVIFQRKRMSLAFNLSFHKDFQNLGSRGEKVEEIL